MKQNNRFCVLALTAVLALTLTACSETADGSACLLYTSDAADE